MCPRRSSASPVLRAALLGEAGGEVQSTAPHPASVISHSSSSFRDTRKQKPGSAGCTKLGTPSQSSFPFRSVNSADPPLDTLQCVESLDRSDSISTGALFSGPLVRASMTPC
ncbi:hypothetical protein NDU88_001771 [Pleurodeles waltl]|uniref:Uncharacterized protein n=1 Tax=Pleurodeles waltl TaxID=8319 RepID=A0AAV7UVN2_PLEWA|nr:hypothetical protein NDU88_001771 [Pleurodeles waltl]